MNSHSQDKQDQFIAEYFGFHPKVFIDIGAYNGIELSNTYALETDHRWSGVCVEANPHTYQKLVENRPNCKCIHAAAWKEDNSEVEFMVVKQHGPDCLCGIKETLDKRHIERINRESQTTEHELVKVNTITINTIIENYLDGMTPDFLKIDIEGGEFTALQGLDFLKHNIPLISVEANYPSDYTLLLGYLYSKGYNQIKSFPFAGEYYFERKI